MPFNAADQTQPPYTQGIMTLTNDECVQVKEACQKIYDEFVSSPEFPVADMQIVVSRYNISTNYEEAINGDTYYVLEAYNPEYNTQGIDTNGIIPEPVVEEPEAPADEEEAMPEETTTEEEMPVVDETEASEAQPEEEVAPATEETTTEV